MASEPGVEAARLGRFAILELLGRGGMGEVYSAYDPNLDRRVALKLLRPRARRGHGSMARARLMREAQALARLAHPNIVPVHDVGVIGEQIFVVMEFVEGVTLRAYCEEKERTWREIVAVYLQVAAGLGKAHEMGVVHRDFKPDNAVVGTDGRVRVIDFGLARDLGEHPFDVGNTLAQLDGESGEHARARSQGVANEGVPEPMERTVTEEQRRPVVDGTCTEGDADDPTPHTATRALLGTPAYMSPEQFRSARVGPSTDQFSFCVSLYEALFGQRPFAKDALDELREEILAGRVRTPENLRGVPPHVYAAVCRGLATDPEERFPSMAELASALARDPHRRASRIALVVAVALACLGAGYTLSSYVQRDPVQPSSCQGGPRQVAKAWNADQRHAVRARILGMESAYASEVWSRVESGLDEYAERWVAGFTDACVVHREGAQSDELLDRRMRCLDRRLGAMEHSVAVLTETTRESLPRAIDVVHEMPAVDSCADIDELLAEVAPPASPAIARAVDEVRSGLDRIRALEHMGRYREVREQTGAVSARVQGIDYPPVRAEVRLAEGRAFLLLEVRADAIEPLERAALIAIAADMNAVALEALARLIYALGATGADGIAKARTLAPYAQALAEQPPGDAFAHALLLNNIGVVHMSANEREEARRWFERALEVRDSDPGLQSLELVHLLQNLAMVETDDERRESLMRQAVSELESHLGGNHPRVLHARLIHARYVADLDEALALVAASCDAYALHFPERQEQRASCRAFLAKLYSEAGDDARAAQHFESASREYGDTFERWGRGVDRAYSLLTEGAMLQHQGEYKRAIERLREAYQAFEGAGDHWWLRGPMLDAQIGMSRSRIALGQHDQAVEILRAALEPARQQTGLSAAVEHEQRLAAVQQLLGRALIARHVQGATGGPCPLEALELLDRAEAWYRAAGGYPHWQNAMARARQQLPASCRPLR